jgi:hypothetical protein
VQQALATLTINNAFPHHGAVRRIARADQRFAATAVLVYQTAGAGLNIVLAWVPRSLENGAAGFKQGH